MTVRNFRIGFYVYCRLQCKFPNLLITYDHRHASKHGRDIGDSAISLAQRASNELSMRNVGFRDPKRQLPEIRQIIEEYKDMSQSKTSTVIVLWYKSKPGKISYQHLQIEHMDAPSCRRATRSEQHGYAYYRIHKYSGHLHSLVKCGL